MITVAPELNGSMEFIKAVSPECVVSLGHTDCDYETAINAIDNGAKCLTHTYNAMPPLHHRNPGPIGAAFEKHIYAQLICDGFHISKPVVLATYKMIGIQFDDAVKMASETPANMLEIKKGRIEKGYDADLLIVDNEINIKTVIISGKVLVLNRP